jgi:hypothetical protein
VITAQETEVLIDTLRTRTYQWKNAALARWLGQSQAVDHGAPAAELSLDSLTQIDGITDARLRHGLRHRFIDLYLQDRLRAHDAEMQVMIQGAAAHVNGHKIYLREVIPWCQAAHTWSERQLLQRETSALCRFLKPYVLAHWEESLTRLRTDFGYADYGAYCAEKKGVAYETLEHQIRHFLGVTRALYFDAMGTWCRAVFGRPMADLTRFDAIHLLGWGAFTPALEGRQQLRDSLRLLETWGMPLASLSHLHLHTNSASQGATQAMTLLLRVPGEIHIVMAPSGGWIDLETLWHELGHGLAASFTPPELPLADRELATDHSLSEAYAFLLQGAILSEGVLTDLLGLTGGVARRLGYYKALRDLAVFRRYAAKFLWELALFRGQDLGDGASYAQSMRHHTGFYHQPESHLFDLTPEFYCCDYLRGMLMAQRLGDVLTQTLGARWPLTSAAGNQLRRWWAAGHTADIDAFCAAQGVPAPDVSALGAHWEGRLAAGPPA